jgi:putative transcriptional regulator
VHPGDLLIATPLLADPNFARTVVYLFSFEDGAAGVILDRPTDIPVERAMPGWETAAASPAVVHLGGPVQVEHGVALARGVHADMVSGDVGVVDLDGDPSVLAPGSLRIFAGYAGWGPGQLGEEIEEGSWFVVPGTVDDLLDPDPGSLWRRVLARQPDHLSRFATYPDDPRLN